MQKEEKKPTSIRNQPICNSNNKIRRDTETEQQQKTRNAGPTKVYERKYGADTSKKEERKNTHAYVPTKYTEKHTHTEKMHLVL